VQEKRLDDGLKPTASMGGGGALFIGEQIRWLAAGWKPPLPVVTIA
jgi:hypothetical protein